MHRAVAIILLLLIGMPVGVYAADMSGKAPAAGGTPVNAKVTCYAPGVGGKIEGKFETSKPQLTKAGKNGPRVPITLDDVYEKKSSYVTLACNPKNYEKMYYIGTMQYRSVKDPNGPIRTINNLYGYCHDTGSAFNTGISGCQRYHTCPYIYRKFDIAYGDFRGKKNLEKLANFGICANTEQSWKQTGGYVENLPDGINDTGGGASGSGGGGYSASTGQPIILAAPAQGYTSPNLTGSSYAPTGSTQTGQTSTGSTVGTAQTSTTGQGTAYAPTGSTQSGQTSTGSTVGTSQTSTTGQGTAGTLIDTGSGSTGVSAQLSNMQNSSSSASTSPDKTKNGSQTTESAVPVNAGSSVSLQDVGAGSSIDTSGYGDQGGVSGSLSGNNGNTFGQGSDFGFTSTSGGSAGESGAVQSDMNSADTSQSESTVMSILRTVVEILKRIISKLAAKLLGIGGTIAPAPSADTPASDTTIDVTAGNIDTATVPEGATRTKTGGSIKTQAPPAELLQQTVNQDTNGQYIQVRELF